MFLSPWKGGAGGYPNLCYAYSPFQFDGNFGVRQVLYVMVLVFRARGGFELDILEREGCWGKAVRRPSRYTHVTKRVVDKIRSPMDFLIKLRRKISVRFN
jgi:hypothetical protein